MFSGMFFLWVINVKILRKFCLFGLLILILKKIWCSVVWLKIFLGWKLVEKMISVLNGILNFLFDCRFRIFWFFFKGMIYWFISFCGGLV